MHLLTRPQILNTAVFLSTLLSTLAELGQQVVYPWQLGYVQELI